MARARMSRIPAIALVVLAVTSAAASGGTQNDGGSGGDAGNTKDAALLLGGFGSYAGELTPHDRMDWYRVNPAAAEARCVSADARGDNNMSVELLLESPERSRAFSAVVPAGTTGRLALAVPLADRAFLHLEPAPNDANSGAPARPGPYAFSWAGTQPPTSNVKDALSGGDASRSSPVAIGAGCTGGRIAPLSGMGDVEDTFSFAAAAGETITYSFAAASGSVLELALYKDGVQVGPSIRSGEMASHTTDVGGSFTLTAMSVSGVDDTGYVIGLIIGPEPPGSGCKPNCVSVYA